MTLPNCKCGDAPVSQKMFDPENCDIAREHEVHCLGCGIYIYAPTQEQAETLWTDAQEAAELREKLVEHLYSDCGQLKSKDLKKIQTYKPTHGNCCTCQECGYPHDDCVCEHNKWCDFFSKGR